MSSPDESAVAIDAAVRRWLESVVIGLNLCPFAARPFRSGQLSICVSSATRSPDLLTELQRELTRLSETPASEIETTIIVVPRMLADFGDYNDFFDRIDALLERGQWIGEIQIASFHPHYQFADTQPDDADNLTNRAPFPLLHLLRESSVEAALDAHPDPERIPQDNVRKMRALSIEQKRQLFGYLKL